MPHTRLPIRNALVSVYNKGVLDILVPAFKAHGVTIYSTGGTYNALLGMGIVPIKVEDLTGFPEILGGRVKTLHPKVFGGILSRRDQEDDIAQTLEHDIPSIDLVVVDLYPFSETVNKGCTLEEAIEKIDIGGVSLLRPASKNYKHVAVVHHSDSALLVTQAMALGGTQEEQRLKLATETFAYTSAYDSEISTYLRGDRKVLRYGENPHQNGYFTGNLDQMFTQLHGKELSYNNLLDIDAGLRLIHELGTATSAYVVIKHNNPCGAAYGNTPLQAWERALSGDPLSAFGGVITSNREVDAEVATAISSIFFELLCSPSFTNEALDILKSKKNRILLQIHNYQPLLEESRTILNGTLHQNADFKIDEAQDWKTVTHTQVKDSQKEDLYLANILAKNSKSNAIVLVKNGMQIGIGAGQTSRVDAVKAAIAKAKQMGLPTEESVMASDAFFPFVDGLAFGIEAGITAIIQPGGSIKDSETIDYCNSKGVGMVFTGTRHFKH